MQVNKKLFLKIFIIYVSGWWTELSIVDGGQCTVRFGESNIHRLIMQQTQEIGFVQEG